jgi:serine/threonine protein kinase
VLAALCYRIVTGSHYLDFSPVRPDALRQIAELPPRAFSAIGAMPWSSLEGVLRRALEKDPRNRFPSVRAFSEALRALPIETPLARGQANGKRRGRRTKGVSSVWTLLGATDPRFDSGYTTSPTCSITHSAAGAAWPGTDGRSDGIVRRSARCRQWMRIAEAHRRSAGLP